MAQKAGLAASSCSEGRVSTSPIGDISNRPRKRASDAATSPRASSSATSDAASEPFDFVISASSSGSTQTGLQYGFHKGPTRYIGVACDPEPELVQEFAALAGKLDELLEEEKGLTVKDFRFDLRFVGDGYGIPSEEGNRAIEYLARREGIFLDPIYSGKAFAGLLHMARNGEIDGRVCFWHTGGTPTLFV